MADDAQFDPLAGIMTPQMLQLQRQQQLQAAMAAANAPQVRGIQAAAKATGLTLGNAIGQMSGGGTTDLASRIAQQNQNILMDQGPQGPSQQVQGGAGAPDASQGPAGAAPADPYEAQAQQYMAKAKQFHDAGQFDTANKFVQAAYITRKQGADMAKSAAEAYKNRSQGDEAKANQNELKPVIGADGKPGFASIPKVGGAATAVTGAQGVPSVPMVSIDMKERQPFIDQFAKSMDAGATQVDNAQQTLATIHDMQKRVDAGMITGTGSDFNQAASTALQTSGFINPDPKLANTKAFASEALKVAMEMKQSGMRLTQNEITWFKQASAGDLSMTPESLKAMLSIMQKGQEGRFETYNRKADTIAKLAQTDAGYKQVAALYPRRELPKFDDATPPAAAPAPAASAAPQTATGPNGQKLVLKNGAWVPL